MGSKGINVGAIMVLVALLWTKTMAQSSCTNVLISMAPCLNYVTGSSSTPTSSCCTQLATVVRSQPQCLCLALNGGGASLGISINQTLALSLPSACKVQTPPVSRCNAVNGPGVSPAGSPESLPGDSSSASGGLKAVSARGSNFSKIVNIYTLLQLLLFVLFIAST